jgi:FkbM family methyltransferase
MPHGVSIRDFHREVLERNSGHMFYCEPHITALYLAVLRPGSVAVDGGANIGMHSIRMAQAVVPDGVVLAIEPVPELRECLRQHLGENLIPESTVRIFPYALSSKPGEADFFQVLDPIQHEFSGLLNRSVLDQHETRKISVTVATLDDLCRDLPRLDFLKLDIEGAELDALRGGTAAIERFRPVIVFEQSQDSPRYFGYTWAELLSYFTARGYEIYDLFGLHYSDPELLDQCVVWDFIGLPQEYPHKAVLFDAVRASMESMGIVLPGRNGKHAATNRFTCVLDRIGSSSGVMQRTSVRVATESAIEFSGWAVDRDGGAVARSVELDINGTCYRANYGEARGDIAAYFNDEKLRDSGFRLSLPSGVLAPGTYTVTVCVACSDSTQYEGARVDFTVE